ncbi:hypothetical protein ACFL35_02865 [Candidatus Riflebacteria bacterium]
MVDTLLFNRRKLTGYNPQWFPVIYRGLTFMEIIFSMTVFLILMVPLMGVQSTNFKMVSRAQADSQAAALMKSETEALMFENYENIKSYSKTYDDAGNLTEGSWSQSDQSTLTNSDRHYAKTKWGGRARFILTVSVVEDGSRVKKNKKISITVFVKSNLLGYIRYRGYLEKSKPEDVPGKED